MHAFRIGYARTYKDRIEILDHMREADEHVLTNIAVSMDITLDDNMDRDAIYERISSELALRRKYEVRS